MENEGLKNEMAKSNRKIFIRVDINEHGACEWKHENFDLKVLVDDAIRFLNGFSEIVERNKNSRDTRL